MKNTKILMCVALCAASINSTQADTSFVASLNTADVISNTPTTVSGILGTADFTLSTDGSQLAYTVNFTGLDLETPGNRTGVTAVDKIHLHAGPVGGSGPHTLNIFGLPSEDDADLSIDYANNSLSGIWSDSDALDSMGSPYNQEAGGTTKFLSDFTDELLAGEIYLAVHTVGEGGSVAVRGQLNQVPEPAAFGMTLFAALGMLAVRRRR